MNYKEERLKKYFQNMRHTNKKGVDVVIETIYGVWMESKGALDLTHFNFASKFLLQIKCFSRCVIFLF